MRWNVLRVVMGLFLAGVFGLTGCGGGGSDNPPNNNPPPTNAAPVANAGAAQSVVVGALVTLDGSASGDANGDPLTYSWIFAAKPNGSSAALSNATVVKPTFTADVAGDYIVHLVVNDGQVNSAIATVTVTAAVANAVPVANAGAAQSVVTGALVTLDGSASSDANGDTLTYSWTFAAKPNGSSAALSNATVVKPTFTADVAGDYVMHLEVNDGQENSAIATVTVTAAVANAVPAANAGAAQSVDTGALVTLDGSASSDANGDPLTYSWAFTSKPSGSSAALSNATVVKPTFTADVAGDYVVHLVVNDGKVNSPAATVAITARTPTLSIISTAFSDLANIPSRYAGASGVNPPLSISGVSANTLSLVLIVDDPDAANFNHWLLWNIPATTTTINEYSVPSGAVQGINDFGLVKYSGPTPPPPEIHTYFFTLYALNSNLSLAAGASRTALDAAMSGKIISTAIYKGKYQTQ